MSQTPVFHPWMLMSGKDFLMQLSPTAYLQWDWKPAGVWVTWMRDRRDVIEWLEHNCKARYRYRHACYWAFEDLDDAMMFRLAWEGVE